MRLRPMQGTEPCNLKLFRNENSAVFAELKLGENNGGKDNCASCQLNGGEFFAEKNISADNGKHRLHAHQNAGGLTGNIFLTDYLQSKGNAA